MNVLERRSQSCASCATLRADSASRSTTTPSETYRLLSLLADFARHLCRPVDGRHAARTISKVVPGPPHGSLHKRRADGQQESYHGGALPTRAGRHGQ